MIIMANTISDISEDLIIIKELLNESLSVKD